MTEVRGVAGRVAVRCIGAALVVLLTDGRLVAAPPHLPRYDLVVEIDSTRHVVEIRERVTWTNTTAHPRGELVFNFYPHYQVPNGDYSLLAKTLEMLRLPPREGVARGIQCGDINEVRVVSPDPRDPKRSDPLVFSYVENRSTAFTVSLPAAVPPGASITVELNATVRLPNKQGRWGHWKGVSYLTNALPILAFCDDSGWRAMPFVPWHQPWFNEAGVFRATVVLPARERLACPAVIRGERDLGDGRKQIETEEFVGRDFAILSSERYREFRSECRLPDGRAVKLKCLAFPEHEFYANEILRIVGQAIPVYSRWFGAFPYPEFTVVESYFGWNGNECAGLIMIDERVFGMPKLAKGYAEYLVSHETCHQWWYNLVGTNGYSETFIDEGAAVFFTHRLLDRIRGPNNDLMNWPAELDWLPNMRRDNYRWSYMQGVIRKKQMQPAAQDLEQFGHLFQLFAGAYDRGSKVFGMIEAQLGEEAFFDFIRGLVAKYSFRVLQAADFRRELEAYTGRDWGQFFDRWVYGKGMTDWAIEDVKVAEVGGPRVGPLQRALGTAAPRPGARYTASALLRQKGDHTEPTIVRFQPGSGPAFDVPVGLGEPIELPDDGGTVVPVGDGTWRIDVSLPSEPEQITVDPDRVLLDADIRDNTWKPLPPRWHLNPLYTMLDETDLTNDYDRWNFGAGPWVGGAIYPDPWYTRSTMIGVRAGAYRTQIFSGGLYAAYRTDYRDVVVGADGLWDHWPNPRTQVGFNFEHRVVDPIGTNSPSGQNRAALYARYVLQYGSSLYLPPMEYLDAFTTYTDDFLPFTRTPTAGGVRPSWWELTGVHYRKNAYTPYWDPEGGFWVDGWFGAGPTKLVGNTQGTEQARGELAAVQKLPDALGPYLSEVRAAARVVVEGAFPNKGEFFALGGGTLFRGYDLAQRQGSMLWVTNFELRTPVVRDVRWDALDHVVGARNLYAVGFWDVGAVYADGRRVGNVAQALGVGLRVDTSIFSFIERATLRFDAAKTINDATPFQFWFGVQHTF